jgi:hypothetical protein
VTRNYLLTDDEPIASPEGEPDSRAADATRREVIIRQRLDRHRFVLGLSLAILLASFLLRLSDTEVVRVPGLNVALPPLCGSRNLFNAECPGCGLSRSFIALAAGDVARSIGYHRVGWVLALAVILQIPYRTLALRELRRNEIVDRNWPTWFGNFLIALLIGNWLLKITLPL